MRPKKKTRQIHGICVSKTLYTSSFSNLALATSNFNLLSVASQRLKFEIGTKTARGLRERFDLDGSHDYIPKGAPCEPSIQ